MPVEIRELQIITTVQDSGSKPQSAPGAAGHEDELVAKCVEQVLAILKEKTER